MTQLKYVPLSLAWRSGGREGEKWKDEEESSMEKEYRVHDMWVLHAVNMPRQQKGAFQTSEEVYLHRILRDGGDVISGFIVEGGDSITNDKGGKV